MKMDDFWSMRKALGELKTSANLDDIDEDIEFSKLWNMEHPNSAYDNSDLDDHDIDNACTP